MLYRKYKFLWLFLFVLSCNDTSKLEEEISKIDIEVVVERFDKAFYKADSTDLPQLKQTFPFLFSKRLHDSIVINRLNDELQDEMLSEVLSAYDNFEDTEVDIVRLFQHLKYYDKLFKTPRVVTLTNDVAYRDKVIVTDTIVLIALDNFLGKDHKYYQSIPKFIASNLEEKDIVPSLANAYAKRYTFQAARQTLLDEMIYFGKLLYFKDKMIPFKSDAEKMGYTPEQLAWAEANESAIWSYFVEKELLFSTDSKLPVRFIADAPFSKFYLQLDNESPGRLGQYMGWQIVKAFAKNSELSLMEVLRMDPEELFNQSKFKPKK